VWQYQNTCGPVGALKRIVCEAIKMKPRLGTVAHTCNPSYSGGRDQEDHGSEPAWANSSKDPILKIQKGLVEWLKVKVLSCTVPQKKKK
jgi:hypothetical protein